MTHPDQEPYEISPRFYLAMQARAVRLEANAAQDEHSATTLEHPEHVERQHHLARAQREQAKRFRSFLADTRIRIADPTRAA